jgi:prolyl-tRNA synthetase
MEMIEVYRKFVEEYLAIPVIKGRKSESEKFAGAEYTTSIETMMQDGKALQAGTSHMLGQNFARAFDVKFLDKEGKEQYVWQTSWGVSTRLIGALIMAHSDDKGLVLPPKIAPLQTVIIPIWGSSEEEKEEVLNFSRQVSDKLREGNVTVKIDDRDERAGVKFFEWEKKGIPVRIEIGPRDVIGNSVVSVRRDTGEKKSLSFQDISVSVKLLLDEIQNNLFDRSLRFREENTRIADSWEQFEYFIANKGGFVLAHWCGSAECEDQIKENTKATNRCLPFDSKEESGKCVVCGKDSKRRVIFAKAY